MVHAAIDAVLRTLAPLGGFLASLLLLCVTIAFGWWLLWTSTISKLPFVQDMLGNREKKRRMRAEKEIEIQQLKAEHARNRSGPAAPKMHRRPSSRVSYSANVGFGKTVWVD